MIDNQKRYIDDIFARNADGGLSCFKDLYRFLEQNKENAPALLRYAMEIDILPRDGEIAEKYREILSEERWLDCRKMSQQVLERLSNLNEEYSVFYKRLWEHISSSCYVNDEERGFSMFAMAYNVRMPYHRMDEEERMSDDEFQTVTEMIYPAILKGVQILIRRRGLQRTQVASLLLKEMNKLDSDVQKAVFWAQILNFLNDDEGE